MTLDIKGVVYGVLKPHISKVDILGDEEAQYQSLYQIKNKSIREEGEELEG